MRNRLLLTGVVSILLILLSLSAALAQEDMAATVSLGGNDDLGAFLVGPEGMTLYSFAIDEPGVSACYDECAVNWPPLTVEGMALPTLDAGVSGQLGVINRDDGLRQVVYNGMPLYYWINDAAPGDATGQGVNDVWFVAEPPLVGLGGNDELGPFLVGSDGMTLYTFAIDEPGTSACNGDCAVNWPPLAPDAEMGVSVQPGLGGTFGIITRDDGTEQVTYNGMPLYTWINDAAPGDATGHEVNEVWFVAAPPLVNLGGNDELGDFLVGPNGMTLYLFAIDADGVSECYDDCAFAWPPLTVPAGVEPTAGEGVMGELTLHERTDGAFQVVYDGWPLYYWIRDVVPGDATGEGVNDVWFVLGDDSMMDDSGEDMAASDAAAAEESDDLPDY